MKQKKGKKNNGGRVARTLYVFYVLSLIGAAILIGGIIAIMLFFKPDPAIADELTPSVTKNIEEPSRGSILARDGRMFAVSFTSYIIAMDCSVLKEQFANDPNGAEKEQEWLDKARKLSEGLATFFPEKTAKQYYSEIRRDRKQGKRYRVIGQPVDYETLQRIKKLPLFNEGPYKGGLVVSRKEVRQYPYGTLARRAIGYVRDNDNASSNRFIGIEGKFNSKLHGEAGFRYTRRKDGREAVQTFDSTAVKAVDGYDIRTTLDVDIQDLTDRALKARIDTNRKIEGACAMVMDVKTGALRAMVNLRRDKSTGKLEETYNYAIGRAGEPGSVFKASTLMTLLEDKHITSLKERIPTNGGDDGLHAIDQHIKQYEREHHTSTISILEGLEMSSNYVFSYLAYQYYSQKPQEFLNKLYLYKLGEAFDFDIEGMAAPSVRSTTDKNWSITDLGSTAYGYAVTETPLHILTFYNAIANNGKMMKPYLVESIEKNGNVKEKLGPSILNSSICSKATADTITNGLVSVVRNGTATRLKDAKCQVAGKTGTARVILEQSDDPKYAGRYEDGRGRKKNQGTFVGFFPADNPQYSFIIVIYSVLSSESFYGGTIPAQVAREIVDGIYTMDPFFRKDLAQKAEIPVMEQAAMASEEARTSRRLPDFTGMGLADAIYLAESMELTCEYSGVGHVISQSPAAGTKTEKGDIITIALK